MRHLRTALALVAFALQAAPASAQYTFTPIATSGDAFDPLGFAAPVLNDAGAVAFNATLADPDFRTGIFRASGGVIVPIALEDGFSRFGNPTINAAGQVGFEASLSTVRGEGIFRGDGGPPIPIAGTRDAGDFDFVNAGPSINAAGRVAFIGERIVGPDFLDGVYAGDGGPVAPIYDTTGPFDDFTGNPALNGAGVAAFLATLDTGVGGLFLGSGGAFTTIADESGMFTSVFSFGDPTLNEAGEVAFRAGTNPDPAENFGATGEGIFLFRGGTVTAVFEGSVGDFGAISDPALNDLGRIAFLLTGSDFSTQTLLAGPDSLADRVIGTGDTLLGRTVTGLLFSREGLNNAGQLAFAAFFDDGSSGIFLATPSAVPEPASLATFGLGALLVLARRRRRARA